MRLVPLLTSIVLLSSGAHAQSYEAVEAFPVDVFSPVELVTAPGQPDRAYIVEQGVAGPSFDARIRTLRIGDTAASTFLDLGDRVLKGGEAGFLGMAFHPGYADNGRVFVSYTAANPRRSVISEFRRSESDPLAADPGSERVVLEVNQPEGNHNGGQITFGPDGYLYIGLGDGGGAGDPEGNGQNTSTLLGSILRVDVDTVPEGEAYGIPETNPFALTDGPERDEIYAYGFRNPWRFAFDTATDSLWVMDVGQGLWEEISSVQAGKNYGWGEVEGPACFRSGCTLSTYEPPVFSYSHDQVTGGFSISGGMVYHGSEMPSLQGQVLYADYVTRRVWALDISGSQPDTTHLVTLPAGSPQSGISAVREGPDGEPYILMHAFGGATRILKIESIPVADEEGVSVVSSSLSLSGPNPFRERTQVTAQIGEGGSVRVTMHDVLGRELVTVFEGTLAPGEARPIAIPGASWPSGMYVVRLVSETRSAVQTLHLIR